MSDYKVKAWSWCADYCKKNHWNPYDSYFWDKAMLEYRRENNIFEVGDWIFIEGATKGKELHKLSIDDIGSHWINLVIFRHATQKEIQAGRRL